MSEPPRRVPTGLARGARLRCPNCGRGTLFARYLKVSPTCDVCGNDNGQYRADDAPPYFTILIVCHLVVGPLLAFPFIWKAPLWVVLGTTLPALLLLTLVLLPRVKGAVIGFHWAVDGRPKPGAADRSTRFGAAP